MHVMPVLILCFLVLIVIIQGSTIARKNSRISTLTHVCYGKDLELEGLRQTASYYRRAYEQVVQDAGGTWYTKEEHTKKKKKPAPQPDVKNVAAHWVTLGIEPVRDKAAIEKAFRVKSLLVHPDKGGTPEAFIKLQKAKEAALMEMGFSAG